MADISTFSGQFLAALEKKTQWYESEKLPDLQQNYRLLHTCVKNLYDLLIKKSCIKQDPYKLDKKISEVIAPEDTQFTENERAMIIGTRFSDYESMLDFICTYYQFSCSYITLARIKALVALGNSFAWHDFSQNSPKPNTRGLAGMLFTLRQNSDPMTASNISDNLSKCSRASKDINALLKDLSDFQKETYKGLIRKDLFAHSGFDMKKAETSGPDEMQLIRKLYPAVMGKTPFYSALVEEIIKEDHDANKEQIQAAVIAKLGVQEEQKVQKVQKIDTAAMLIDTVHALSAVAPVLGQLCVKIQENHDAMENMHNSFWDKVKRVLRQAFKLSDPPLVYQIHITDTATHTDRVEKLDYNEFMAMLKKRVSFYSALTNTANPYYKKIVASKQDAIIDFLNKQFTECQKLLVHLAALDNFFKNMITGKGGVHAKGMKMELVTLKNTIVKANQRRAEYISYIEEEAELKKLGITDVE